MRIEARPEPIEAGAEENTAGNFVLVNRAVELAGEKIVPGTAKAIDPMAKAGMAAAEVGEFVGENSAKLVLIEDVEQREADHERFFPPAENAEARFLDHAGIQLRSDEDAVEGAGFATGPEFIQAIEEKRSFGASHFAAAGWLWLLMIA